MDMALGQLAFEEYAEATGIGLKWCYMSPGTKEAFAKSAEAVKRQVLEESGLKEI